MVQLSLLHVKFQLMQIDLEVYLGVTETTKRMECCKMVHRGTKIFPGSQAKSACWIAAYHRVMPEAWSACDE